MTKYEPLPITSIAQGNGIICRANITEIAHLDDPAINVMTDFSYVEPITIHANQSIQEAEQEMEICTVHLLLVIDDTGNLSGLLGSGVLHGALPIKIAQEKRIPHAQIKVRMVMTPLAKIDAIDYDLLQHAKVGNVINTLKHLEKHHLLVTKLDDDEANGKQTVVGLFSASAISKKTHLNVADFITAAHSIAELQKRHTK